MKRTPCTIHPAYLRPRDAAIYTGTSVDTLKKWRACREGPPWIKLDRLVLYKIEELDKFMEERMRKSRESKSSE
jgi:hypothetical protein